MWSSFPQTLATSILAILVACLAVRFVVPSVLRALVAPAREIVSLVASVLVLPEYWISHSRRRKGGTPPHFAYVYGDGIARLACLGDSSIVLLLRSLARAALTVHPIAVALLAVTLRIVVSL